MDINIITSHIFVPTSFRMPWHLWHWHPAQVHASTHARLTCTEHIFPSTRVHYFSFRLPCHHKVECAVFVLNTFLYAWKRHFHSAFFVTPHFLLSSLPPDIIIVILHESFPLLFAFGKSKAKKWGKRKICSEHKREKRRRRTTQRK
jgi:hypothetical protein